MCLLEHASGKVAGKRAQIIVITAACHRRESGEARCGGHADVIACRLRICFGCQKLRVVLDSKRHSFDRRSGKTRQGRWLFEIARGKANEAQIRSEERRVGKECVRTGGHRGWPYM